MNTDPNRSQALNTFAIILKTLSNVRHEYPDIKDAIRYVSYKVNEDYDEIVNLLISAGIYVPNDSETGKMIHEYIDSVKDKFASDEIIDRIGFYWCICDQEAERLYWKFATRERLQST
jgi:hypothetical protein